MSTPHNNANKGDFAKTVLMPGDPLRAKYIAEHFLTDVVMVNGVRNMFAYTGFYKGKKVSVMGSGMGMPSIGIYCHELFNFYDVDKIIRIGSAGSYQENVKVFDLVIGESVSTDSNFGKQFLPYGGQYSPCADFEMLNQAYEVCKKKGFKVHVGNIMSSDIFYNANPDAWKQWKDMGTLAVEMESYALYTTAAYYHKKALTILTISDSLITHQVTTAEEREQKFNEMMEVALEIA